MNISRLSGAALVRATGIGFLLQVVMVVAGHFVPAIAGLFAVGGMGFSALAGWLYGRAAPEGAQALLGGGLAGGLCALLGIGVSVAFGDVPPSLLALGTGSSVVTGVVGAGIAKLFARR
jgi:hypothetical protein